MTWNAGEPGSEIGLGPGILNRGQAHWKKMDQKYTSPGLGDCALASEGHWEK